MTNKEQTVADLLDSAITVSDEVLYDVYATQYTHGIDSNDDDPHARPKRALFEGGLIRGLKLAQQIIAGEDSIEWARNATSSTVSVTIVAELDDMIEAFTERWIPAAPKGSSEETP